MSPLLPNQNLHTSAASWVVLDTAFADGTQFLATWLAWTNLPNRPRILHYVALLDEQVIPDWFTFAEYFEYDSCLEKLASHLAEQCQGVGSGFQRILLDDGYVSLTLCIGKLPELLSELRLQADAIWLDVFVHPWQAHALKTLTRHCKRGTIVHLSDFEDSLIERLQQQGFLNRDNLNPLQQVFAPHWNIKTSRQKHLELTHQPGRCAIIGAGLSGSCTAQALARRGWQVTVYERNPTPAQEASGVPAAIVAPYTSADNNPRSQISLVGTRLMLQHAHRFLKQGVDWDATGVQEQRFHQEERLQPIWHTLAGWIKPAALVRSWLQQTGITFVGSVDINSIEPYEQGWALMDQAGHAVGYADIVILANAMGSIKIAELEGLQAIDGSMSYGYLADVAGNGADWPHHPVNGHGNFIPAIPSKQGNQWITGATFQAMPEQSHHQFNFGRLETLLPQVARDLQPIFAQQAVQSWSSRRCVTSDRMPWVGAIQPKLWINVGMGARGLSFVTVCTELLAAQICGEPLPIQQSLAKKLDVSRVIKTT